MRVYLISLWAFLPVLAGCEPNANGLGAPTPITLKAGANQWQAITSRIDNLKPLFNASRPNNRLKTSIQGPNGPIDLEIRCDNHLVQVTIDLKHNEVATTPLYSSIDGKWSHVFHVDFMNSAKSINQRLPARQSAPTSSSYIVSNVRPDIFRDPDSDGHLKFQTLPKNSITVFYDEHVRTLAKSCNDSS